jgi:hypothetical protein
MECITDHGPAVLMHLPQIGIRNIGAPMILVSAVIRESEIMAPVSKVEDKVEM